MTFVLTDAVVEPGLMTFPDASGATENLIFLFGGSTGRHGQEVAQGFKINVQTNAQTAIAPMHVRRRRPTVLVDNTSGLIYALGGYVDVGGEKEPAMPLVVSQTMEVYNPSANTWTVLANLPDFRSGFGACFQLDTADSNANKIYLVGGQNQAGDLVRTMWVYKVGTDAWTQI